MSHSINVLRAGLLREMLPGIDAPGPSTWRGCSDLHTGTPVVRDSPLSARRPGRAVPLELRPRPHRGDRPAVVPRHHGARLRRPLSGPGIPGAGGEGCGVAGGHLCLSLSLCGRIGGGSTNY